MVTQVLNAANFGVPQKRERVFFVGFRENLGIRWNFPLKTHSQEALFWDQIHGDYWERHDVARGKRRIPSRAIKLVNSLKLPPNTFAWRTVRDAIADLPDPEKRPRKARDFSITNFSQGARSYPGHTGSHLDEPSKTLKAGVHGVPGGENMLLRPAEMFAISRYARQLGFKHSPMIFFFTVRGLRPCVSLETRCRCDLRKLSVRCRTPFEGCVTTNLVKPNDAFYPNLVAAASTGLLTWIAVPTCRTLKGPRRTACRDARTRAHARP